MLLSIKKIGMFLSELVIKRKVDLGLVLCTDGFEIILGWDLKSDYVRNRRSWGYVLCIEKALYEH